MPSGRFEVFKIELIPNYEQKQIWKKIQNVAADIDSAVKLELAHQTKNLGFIIALNFFLDGNIGKNVQGSLSDDAFDYIRTWTYEQFDVKKRARRNNGYIPILLDKDHVLFSVLENIVSIPHLGAIRYKCNHRIVPNKSENSAEKQWLLSNISQAFLREYNKELCLIIDCSEDGKNLKIGTKRRSKRNREFRGLISKWLY